MVGPRIHHYGDFVLVDYKPDAANIREEVLRGLLSEPKYIPTFYHYDERGSQLFDRITTLPEYYLTRLDIEILKSFGAEIAQVIGPRCEIVEFGSGMNEKTLILLETLQQPSAYIPMDISLAPLLELAREIARRFPQIKVLPVCADYNHELQLPTTEGSQRSVVYFPGSTIGNFEVGEAVAFMRRCRELVGLSGGMLVGVDLRKDRSIIQPAYDDSAGVTREFGMNVLHRLARDFHTKVPLENFHHISPYNEEEGRIESYVVCDRDTVLTLNGEQIAIAAGERILTEYSYKFSLEQFAALAEQAGFRVDQVWTDPRGWFSYQWLT